MTRRLYYDNAYQTQFTTSILEHLTVGNQIGLVLEQTYFYPTSGGQPHDVGTIHDQKVTDVYVRESDSAIVHVVAAPIENGSVSCNIEWARRFDHMQHHTGQHILTKAFQQIAGIDTVSFHLSRDSVTIDLDKPPIQLSDAIIHETEQLANQIIQENRQVSAEIIDHAESDQIRIRKVPKNLTTNGLRVIAIQDFDQTACGGTHVSRTGEIGLIKILKIEKSGDGSRVEFCCGNRAIEDYSKRLRISQHLAVELTCHYEDLPDAITKMQAEIKLTQGKIKSMTAQLLEFEAGQMRADAKKVGDLRVITAVFDERDRSELQQLVAQLTKDGHYLALVGTSGEKAHLVFGCHEDLNYNLYPLLQQAFKYLGGGAGGGRPNLVQGGGIAATSKQIESAIMHVMQSVSE